MDEKQMTVEQATSKNLDGLVTNQLGQLAMDNMRLRAEIEVLKQYIQQKGDEQDGEPETEE